MNRVTQVIYCICERGDTYITDLSENLRIQKEEIESIIYTLLPFGVLQYEPVSGLILISDEDKGIARNFLLSYSSLIDKNIPLISDWSRYGADISQSSLILEKGVSFLGALEKRRLEVDSNPNVLDSKKLCNGLIVAEDEIGNKYFLMNLNQRSSIYQFIGGFVRKETSEEAIERELNEELLNGSNQDISRQIIKTSDNEIYHDILSPTFGLYIRYYVDYFYIYIKKEIKLNPVHKWVSLDEIKNSKTNDGFKTLPPRGEVHKIFNLLENSPITYNIKVEEKLKSKNKKIERKEDIEKISIFELLKTINLKQFGGVVMILIMLISGSFTLGVKLNDILSSLKNQAQVTNNPSTNKAPVQNKP